MALSAPTLSPVLADPWSRTRVADAVSVVSAVALKALLAAGLLPLAWAAVRRIGGSRE